MAPMVMPFPAPASASLQGLAPGDKVQFVLLVDWAGPRYVIERIEKLPADTRLELGGRPMKATGASEASR